MDKQLMLHIYTPTKTAFKDYIISFYFTNDTGDMVILKEYSPTIGTIKRGVVKIRTWDGKDIEYVVDSGIYVVANNVLKVMTSFCIDNNENEKNKIDKIRENTLNILNNKNHNIIEFESEIALFKKIIQLEKEK